MNRPGDLALFCSGFALSTGLGFSFVFCLQGHPGAAALFGGGNLLMAVVNFIHYQSEVSK